MMEMFNLCMSNYSREEMETLRASVCVCECVGTDEQL